MGDTGAVAVGVIFISERARGAVGVGGGRDEAAEPVIGIGDAGPRGAVEPGMELEAAKIVAVIYVAGLGGGQAGALGTIFTVRMRVFYLQPLSSLGRHQGDDGLVPLSRKIDSGNRRVARGTARRRFCSKASMRDWSGAWISSVRLKRSRAWL
jgi:hypothetical protein